MRSLSTLQWHVIIIAMGVVSQAIVKLVLIALVGFYLYKKRFIEEKVLEFLTFFVINFTIPFLIFSHLIKNAKIVLSQTLLGFILLSLAIFFVGYILGYIFSFKRSHKLKKEFISLVSFQNCGYLPMNIAFFLFSPSMRDEFLVYIFLYILGFNIILWSVGSFFIFRKKGEEFKVRSLFTPPIVSTLLALVLIYAHISRWIPALILSPIRTIGDTSFVLSMIILGCWLAKIRLKGFYQQLFITSEAAFLKLLVVPLIFIIFVVKLKLFSLLGLFIVLQAAMPSAVSLPIVLNLRGADKEFASQGVFFTHILSIITVPLWLGLFLELAGFSF